MYEAQTDTLHSAGVANSVQTQVNQTTSEALIDIQTQLEE